METMSKLVGHSSTAVTKQVYLHIFETKKRAAAQAGLIADYGGDERIRTAE